MSANESDEQREASEREARSPETSPSRLGQLARSSDALASLVARNPTATPAMLRRLARREHDALLCAVCEHPRTPEPVVYALAERFPEAFAQSARGRDFLADPSQPAPRANHLRARLSWSGAPPSWFDRASLHSMPRVRQTAVELRPALPEAFVARHVRDPDRRVRVALARRSDLPAPWVVALAHDEAPEVRAVVVAREGLPVETMIALARDPSEDVRAAAAKQPAMPSEVLMALSKESATLIHWRLSENPNAPVEALEHLADPPPESVLLASQIARHPRASERVATSLLSHPEAEYRNYLIFTVQKISEALWERLLCDPSDKIRYAIGFRRDAPSWVLARLAVDARSLLRAAAARHESTPEELVAQLARDGDAHVRCCAAENPRASEALLRSLARDSHVAVRAAVAKWTRSSSLLARLGEDRDDGVRAAVFFNPHTPAKVRQLLEHDRGVRWHRSYG